MTPESISALVSQSLPAAMAAGFIAGFLFSFNPVALGAIPVSLAYVTKSREAREAALYGTLFLAGLVATHLALGVVAGLGGLWVKSLLGRGWGLIVGPVLIALGLVWVGWLRLPAFAMNLRPKRATSTWGALTLGAIFTVAICPICTPALAVLVGVAAASSSLLVGGALLLAFGLGRAIPIALGAYAVGWLEHLKGLARFQRRFEVIGGVLLMLSGLYMLNAVLFVIPELAG
jgi:cytochrome c-type biogenesis protein